MNLPEACVNPLWQRCKGGAHRFILYTTFCIRCLPPYLSVLRPWLDFSSFPLFGGVASSSTLPGAASPCHLSNSDLLSRLGDDLIVQAGPFLSRLPSEHRLGAGKLLDTCAWQSGDHGDPGVSRLFEYVAVPLFFPMLAAPRGCQELLFLLSLHST